MFEQPTPREHRATSDSPDMIEYRPVCRSAVTACVLGISSALALTGKPFWALPLIAIPVAIFALWQMARSEELLLGRKAAVAGLFFAALFGSWALASDWSRQSRIEQLAAEHTKHWFDLISKRRLAEAHRLTLSPERRHDPDTPTDNIPGHQSLQNPAQQLSAFDTFLKQDIILELRAAGPDMRYQIVKTHGSVSIGASELVTQDVRVEWLQDGQQKTLPLTIVLQRNFDAPKRAAYWYVQRMERTALPG